MSIHTANRYYNNFISRLSRQKTAMLILYTVGLDVLITLIFSFILFPSHTAGPVHTSIIEGVFIAVLIAPFIETFLFQHFVIKFILSKKATATLASCMISAILFAIGHYYSWQYILKTFLSGLLFASLYLIINYKRQNPILIVFTAHAIYNCIGLIVDILSGDL